MKHPVRSVRPRDSAQHARDLMERHRVNQLPVLHEDRVVGIVTDRDLRDAFPSALESAVGEFSPRRRPPAGTDPETIVVEDLMTHDVLTVSADTPLAEAARLMRSERIGAVPVVERGHVVGILARSDLLEALEQLLAAG
jgi:acetoin utilization protein AcuB